MTLVSSHKSKGLIGVVNPTVLDSANEFQIHACPILEIRYDLFPFRKDWGKVLTHIKELAPKARIIATIRLERDGGKWPDVNARGRTEAWQEMIHAELVPDWMDVEWEYLEDEMELMAEAQERKIKILASHHDFKGIPSKKALEDAVKLAKHWHTDGFKIAATSRTEGDCQALYDLAKEHADDFSWFSAFAMGKTGMASRLFSLCCGANITYGSFGAAVAPGQIPMNVMMKLVAQLDESSKEKDVESWLRAEGLLK